MPRSGDTYSLPAGTAAVSGTQANSSHVNQRFDDLAAEQNAVRPIAAGGTGGATTSAARTALGLAIGSDVQGWDAGLASIAGLTTAANKMIYTTGADTYAVADLTAAGRALLDDADAAAQRATLSAPARPTASAGAGNFVAISPSSGAGYTLPAGGTWAWFAIAVQTSTGLIDGSLGGAGVASGSTTVLAATTDRTYRGFAWRVA